MNSSPLRFFGGKTKLAPWLISHFPPKFKTYCEVFAGGLSPLFSRDPFGTIEVANDIWRELTNFWRVLQSDELFRQFKRLCDVTPFSQVEFEDAKNTIPMEVFGDSVIAAWQFFIINRMSFSGLGGTFPPTTSRTRRKINENVSSWLSVVEKLSEFSQRLRFVEIRSMDFSDFIGFYDSEDAFFYIDPPYLKSTRSGGNYKHEMSDEDHARLLGILSLCRARFLLSGYQSPLYANWANANGFSSFSLESVKDSSTKKEKPVAVETVWRNY